MHTTNGRLCFARQLCCFLVCGLLPQVFGAEPELDMVIYARAAEGYTRTRLGDNTFNPETYTFAEGGCFGSMAGDASMDRITFVRLAKMLAEPLRKRGYVPSFKKESTDFIILIFWGMTGGPLNQVGGVSEGLLKDALRDYAMRPAAVNSRGSEPLSTEAGADKMAESQLDQAILLQGMADTQRDQANSQTADILGFRKELEWSRTMPFFLFSRDIVTEVEAGRYVVVVKAFDFRERVEKRRWKLVWELRYSTGSQGVAFDKVLEEMTNRALRYSGQNINELIRSNVKEGRVDIGTATVVEPVKK